MKMSIPIVYQLAAQWVKKTDALIGLLLVHAVEVPELEKACDHLWQAKKILTKHEGRAIARIHFPPPEHD